MEYQKLSTKTEGIAETIVNSAYSVHNALGAGLLENIYEVCFCHELDKANLAYQRQVSIPIQYDGITFQEGLRLDVLVEDKVICEIKAVDKMNLIYTAQLLSYLKLTGKRLGFLINFNVPVIKNGIKRVIL